MNEIIETIAKILVECGYATGYNKTMGMYWIQHNDGEMCEFEVDICADTLEGYKQAIALEDYFEQRPELWDLWNSFERPYVYDVGESIRDWRLDRIEWCVERHGWFHC